MKNPFADPSSKRILIVAVIILLAIAALLTINLSSVTSEKETADRITIAELDAGSMRLYAQAQRDTGIPWVILCAVDKAEKITPDEARVQFVAGTFVQKGAVEKGFAAAPITCAADLAGLYSNNRKTIEKIVQYMLELQDAYLLIQRGKYPADGGQIADGEDGCRLSGIAQARSPFAGTVKSTADGIVEITCDNGISVRMEGIGHATVEPGARIRAGDTVGDASEMRIVFICDGIELDPYPYLLMWKQ
jgi:hypothetical protein